MENEKKKRIYSIMYLICVVLLINAIPFSLFIEDKYVLFVIDIILKIISIIYIFRYAKKEKLGEIKLSKIDNKIFTLIPLIILCFSNFLVVIFQNVELKTSIDIFNIVSGLISCIGVAVIEELLFRCFVLEEFLKYKGKFLTVVYSSLAFGLTHLLNISSLSMIPGVLIQVCYTFFLGFVLGFIYLKTRNIVVPITLHFLFNLINNIVVTELYSFKLDITYYLINVLVGLLIMVYIIVLNVINKKGDDKHVAEYLDN